MAKKQYQEDAPIEQVEPLKTKRDIHRVQRMLETQGGRYKKSYRYIGRRNRMLFDFGIYTGLRVSDIIKLTVSDVENNTKFREKKTGKVTHIYINDHLRRELNAYIKDVDLKPDDWLFPSTRNRSNHISRYQVYNCIHDAGAACGIDHLGSHTMRKTFGRMWIKQGRSLPTLMHIYNHSSIAVTLRYLGLDQTDINKEMKDFYPDV